LERSEKLNTIKHNINSKKQEIMQKLLVIIKANQNEVSKSEISKIRRELKKELSEYRFSILANATQEEINETSERFENVITFNTYDVNYDVWAEWSEQESNVIYRGRNESGNIALN
jgi:predicted amino acid-binding ACT domain protein